MSYYKWFPDMIVIKRIYEPASKTDGLRILVDSLWPRGVSKARARLDAWMKEIAPSTALRKRFHHDPDRWEEFQKEYFEELGSRKILVHELKTKAKAHTVTLLYGARDTEHNNALALKNYLGSR